jgi:alanine racemase
MESIKTGAVGRFTIDLGALKRAWRALARAAAPADVGAIVSADACGLGAAHAAATLESVGCRYFFTGMAGEALALKPVLSPQTQLYVLNPLISSDEAHCAGAGIMPVFRSADQARRWTNRIGGKRGPAPLLLQATGRGSRTRIPPAIAKAEQCIACRSMDDGPLQFARTLHDLPAAIVSLQVSVVQTRTVPVGDGVGYGKTHIAKRPMRVATISAGYADGIPRSLAHRGSVYFRGLRLPLCGMVSMDTVGVDITRLPQGAIRPGDLVELIGPHQTLTRLAADARTIPSEILAKLGRRYPRDYRT